MKSGNKFLEPSEPLQACNGTALLFLYFTFPSIFGLMYNIIFIMRSSNSIPFFIQSRLKQIEGPAAALEVSLTLWHQDNKPDKHKCLHLHESFSVSIRHRHRTYFLRRAAVLWGTVNLISSPSRSMKGGLLECRKRKELGCHKLLRNPRIRSGIKLLKYLLIQRLELVSTTTRSVQALRFAGSLYLFPIIKLNLQLWYFR